jgi:hypothetical protein
MEQPKDWRYFKNLPPPPQYLNVAIRSKERPKCREIIMKIMSEFKHKCSICKEGSRQMCDYPNILNDLAEGWYYDGDIKMWLTDSLRTQARKMLREKLIKEYKMKTKEKDIEGRWLLAKFLRINEKGGIKNE